MPHSTSPVPSPSRRPAALLSGLAMAALLSGCATAPAGPLAGLSDPSPAAAADRAAEPRNGVMHPAVEEDRFAAANYWGTRFQDNPLDLGAAINYSAALRAIDSADQAMRIMARLAPANSTNPSLLAEYGKTLAATGKYPEALNVLAQASALAPYDWKILSAEGVVLDQIGEHERARSRYDSALKLAPQNPVVLNNLAMSFLLTEETAQAEVLLRQAAASAQAPERVRHNLALVAG
ncbi:MAG: tetratricopeptide repeat protein, partial [Alphaproteobacteria bacterium]|nr:tetratricopeptide repeat protein [Alphaproteobacteria bacterium]